MRQFATSYGWTPSQVAELTPAQIAMFTMHTDTNDDTARIDPVTGHRIVRVESMEEATALLEKIKDAKP